MTTIKSSSSIPISVLSGKSANQSISFSLVVAIGLSFAAVVSSCWETLVLHHRQREHGWRREQFLNNAVRSAMKVLWFRVHTQIWEPHLYRTPTGSPVAID